MSDVLGGSVHWQKMTRSHCPAADAGHIRAGGPVQRLLAPGPVTVAGPGRGGVGRLRAGPGSLEPARARSEPGQCL
jgi:hypothetical protein